MEENELAASTLQRQTLQHPNSEQNPRHPALNTSADSCFTLELPWMSKPFGLGGVQESATLHTSYVSTAEPRTGRKHTPHGSMEEAKHKKRLYHGA